MKRDERTPRERRELLGPSGRRVALRQRARRVAGPLLLLALTGCAHVKPYQRQYLSDRIMDPSAARWEAAAERKMLSTREGAQGSVLGAGGGCACN